jgi:hypothetical protein
MVFPGQLTGIVRDLHSGIARHRNGTKVEGLCIFLSEQ